MPRLPSMSEPQSVPPAPGSRTTHRWLGQPIVFDGSHSPVKTGLFLIVCLAWMLPGLVGRDPWKPDEALAFGVIHSMLQGGSLIVPAIAGQPYFDAPPFAAWIAALCARLLSPIFPLDDGARLASALWMGITMLFCARAARELSDERAGRIAVLTLLGCWGLLLRGHEISFALTPLAGTAIAFYGLSVMDRQPRDGRLWLAIGSAVTALSAGLVPGLIVLAPLGTMMALRPAWRRPAIVRSAVLCLVVTLMAGGLWPAMLWFGSSIPAQQWWHAALGTQGLAQIGRPPEAIYFLRLMPWYALPALPIALWVWIRERKELSENTALLLPLVTFIVMLLGFSLVREPRDDMGLPLLVPLVVVAVLALDRIPRGVASFVDWLGLTATLFIAGLLWSGWAGVFTGFPTGAAKWAARQAPGFVHQLNWFAFAVALSLTFIWLIAALRTRGSNRRALVNWCAGVTLVWMLANLLWLPAVDHVRSYRGTITALKAALPDGANCVAQIGLGDPQRAAFDFHAGLRFQAARSMGESPCPILLMQGVRDREPEIAPGWKMIWIGARPGDNAERFRLYQKS